MRLEAGQESNAFEEHYPDPIKDQIDQWEREGFVFEESGFSQPDPANEDNFVCPKCNRSEGLFYYIWEHPTRRLHITRKGQEIGGRQATRYAYRCKACNYRWTDDPPPQGKPIPVEGGE